MSALATVAMVAGKSYKGKFTAKIDFPLFLYFMFYYIIFFVFYITIADADIGSLLRLKSLSIHYLISIWTTCWWNLSKIVWFELYKILSFVTKNG